MSAQESGLPSEGLPVMVTSVAASGAERCCSRLSAVSDVCVVELVGASAWAG